MTMIMRVADLKNAAISYADRLPASDGLLGAPALEERLQRLQRLREVIPSSFNGAIGKLLTSSVDPALSATSTGLHYERIDGELYADSGPASSDIEQNALGDCYFMAALGSVVAGDPELIRDMIRDEGNGSYSVRFYREQSDGTFRHVWVRVDADLPVDAEGNVAYAGAKDSDGDGKRELWVALVEKAYARFNDQYANTPREGYDDIGSGGHADLAFEAILGANAKRTEVPSSDQELEELLTPVADGEHFVVGTNDDVGAGWVENHSYTVVGTYYDDGVCMVVLRNPSANNEPVVSVDADGVDDGVFAVPIDELRANIATVYSAPPKLNMGEIARIAEALRPQRDDLEAVIANLT